MKPALFALCGGVALAGIAWSAPADACAGCSNPNVPSARAASGALPRGWMSTSFSASAISMRVVHGQSCPEIGPICNTRAEPPQQHDQRFYAAELRPVVAYGITDFLATELQFPLRLVRTEVTFRRMDGTPVNLDYQNIHHRNETVAGIGDPQLLSRWGFRMGKMMLTLRAGFGVPLGKTVEDPFALGDADRPHQHLQFGTGTFHPVLSLDAIVPLDRFRVMGHGQSTFFVYENSYGYQAGNRYSVGVSSDYRVAGGLRIGIGADLVNEQAERWKGVVQQDGNVGRTDLLAGGAISWTEKNWFVSLSVRTPVYQHFATPAGADPAHHDPGQLSYPAIVSLSLGGTFDIGSVVTHRVHEEEGPR